MAHSHSGHREQQVAHRRVNHILKGSPAGAKKHAQGHAFSKITSKTAAVQDGVVKGKSAPKRYAKGGKVKHGHTTNIIIANSGAKPGGPMPLPVGGPPAGGPPMPMPPPGAGPGGPPMPMPMRKRGGKVMTAGAATGVGRLQKAGKK